MTAILLAPAIACGGGDDDDSTLPEGWESFTSDAHQYSIEYPKEWLVRSGVDSDAFTSPTPDHTSVLVEFGAGPDLEADSTEYRDGVVESVRGHSGVEPTVLGVEDLGGRKALLVEREATIADVETYALQAFVPNGDQSWYVTMATSTSTKDDYEETFRQMLDSFDPSE